MQLVHRILFLLALTFTGTTAVATPADSASGFFDPGFGNLKEEAQIARGEGKIGLFVMFDDEDCPWCQKMKANVLPLPHVKEYFRKHFRTIRVDTRGDTLVTDFTGKEMPEKDFAALVHRVRATPVFLFMDLNGKVLTRYTGATKDPKEFLLLGEFVVSGANKTTNFVAYKRQRAGES